MKGWRTRNCTILRYVARGILDAKAGIHRAFGRLVGATFSRLGAGRLAGAFAREFAQRMPLGIDEPMRTAARAIQLIGIFTCSVQDRPIRECACFLDVFNTDGRELLERLLLGATEDWAELHNLQAEGRGPDVRLGD